MTEQVSAGSKLHAVKAAVLNWTPRSCVKYCTLIVRRLLVTFVLVCPSPAQEAYSAAVISLLVFWVCWRNGRACALSL